ncbi:hypothetical protein V8J88_07540 [Massilia sp. W12]|uniref:hypothetical protein n=1 Tax=Massilia sp. W12 TaxID=3126507 RepID=UPI0030CACB37
MKIIHTEDVQELRRKAYPPLEDFADAWYHMQNGNIAKIIEYTTHCGMVKERFVKNVVID